MNVKSTLMVGLKIVILTIILFICFAISSMLVGLTDSAQTTAPIHTMVATLIMCFLHSIVLSYPIIRSRWTGWRLVLTIFFIHYGVMTFLSQIETVVFLQYLTDVIQPEKVPKLFMQGAIIAALFSPLAVLINGKMKKDETQQESDKRLDMPWREWVWKLIMIAIAYIVIYISFGAFVFKPLAGEAFQEYYGDLQIPGWILLFQAGRAMIWTALAIPVIRMMKGHWWETGLAVALLYSVLMGTLLLVPTEVMPKAIRMAHFVEVLSSNFLFGWIVVWLLNRQYGSFHKLFQKIEEIR